MSKESRAREKRRRASLFKKQEGLCHWCHKPMRLLEKYPDDGLVPPDAATIDHLRDRFDPSRRVPPNGDQRYVAAHAKCNHERGRQTEAAAKLRRRLYPRMVA